MENLDKQFLEEDKLDLEHPGKHFDNFLEDELDQQPTDVPAIDESSNLEQIMLKNDSAVSVPQTEQSPRSIRMEAQISKEQISIDYKSQADPNNIQASPIAPRFPEQNNHNNQDGGDGAEDEQKAEDGSHPSQGAENDFSQEEAVRERNKTEQMVMILCNAYKERKELNKNLFSTYAKKRENYYEKHAAVYENAGRGLLVKVKETNQFIPYLTKYFTQMAELYKSFYQNSKKVSAFKYLSEVDNKKADKLNWSAEITQGIKNLLDLRDDTSSKMKTMDYQITSIVSGLEKHLHDYNKHVEQHHKNVEKKKQKYNEVEEDLSKKIKKVLKMSINANEEEKPDKRKDMLTAELEVFVDCSRAKKLFIEWGVTVQQWWEELIKAEKAMAVEIRRAVLAFLELYKDVHIPDHKLTSAVSYWSTLQCGEAVEQKYSLYKILPISQHDFFVQTMRSIYECSLENYGMNEFNIFVQIPKEDCILGDRESIINSLIVKRYDCELLEDDKIKTRVTVVSTVDEFLVVFTDPLTEVVGKMQIRRLMNSRKSDYIVSVNEKIEGFIIDTWNRLELRFKNMDQVEEFMFCTENNPEIKDKYVQ